MNGQGAFHFIDSLKLNEIEQRIFNCGFIGLSERDTVQLMEMNDKDFKPYRHYYNLGDSFCKFETLQKIHSKSDESIDTLKDYAQFRNMDIGVIRLEKVDNINTSNLINELKKAKKEL